MAERLYPERQRCKDCSKKLGVTGAPVYFGLYCSSHCAGIAVPIQDPVAAPRECKTQRDGNWAFKRRYRSETEIPSKLREDLSANHYWCQHCGHLHIGHSRIDLATETHRVLGDRAALCDLLVKSRGKATHKQVGAAAGVRPIRVRELEDPKTEKIDLDALFVVLRVYRMKLGVALRTLKE